MQERALLGSGFPARRVSGNHSKSNQNWPSAKCDQRSPAWSVHTLEEMPVVQFESRRIVESIVHLAEPCHKFESVEPGFSGCLA